MLTISVFVLGFSLIFLGVIFFIRFIMHFNKMKLEKQALQEDEYFKFLRGFDK